MNAVIVISMLLENGEIQCLHSFPDTIAGNKEAEKIFISECDNMFTVWKALESEDIDDIISDGYYDDGISKVFLIHSD